jgi:hypothetical protein
MRYKEETCYIEFLRSSLSHPILFGFACKKENGLYAAAM